MSNSKTLSKGIDKLAIAIDSAMNSEPINETQKFLALAESLKIDVKEQLQPPQIAWQLSNLKKEG